MIHRHFHLLLQRIVAFLFLAVLPHTLLQAQQTPPRAAERTKQESSASAEPQIPAQIELLETYVRFEAGGDSRKEVHARVKINNELGARQFARLNFDFNRSYQSVEIPMVRITHPSGGVAEILPSAITDSPNPAVVNYPAYQDVRVKSVRILGLAPGDLLEYRVITTTTHPPLAPDFWLDHTLDRTGVVSHEIFVLDLPASREESSAGVQKPGEFRINPHTPATSIERTGDGESARIVYRWERSHPDEANPQTQSAEHSQPDVAFSTFGGWENLSIKLAEKLIPESVPLETLHTSENYQKESPGKPDVTAAVKAKAADLAKLAHTEKEQLEAIYDFVSQKIATVDLPIGATGFAARSAQDVLSSGYATPEDKFVLFSVLAKALNFSANAALTGYCNRAGVPVPSLFTHLLVSARTGKTQFWLDPSLEVAPFGLISSIPGKCALVLNRNFVFMNSTGHEWQTVDPQLPFAAFQKVRVVGELSGEGKLTARVQYVMRGENELLLRVTFHKTPKENWKSVAQLLALSDGFRGQVTSVTASDPYATHEPFSVEYEVAQPKFVDWGKKPVRIPAILPLLGLPDLPGSSATGEGSSSIDFGAPLDVETTSTLHLPPGTTARTPTGTSVERDYASYSSSYSARESTVTASRHLHFLLREIPSSRAADYNAFLRAVQNDEAQEFTLDRPSAPSSTASPSTASIHP